MNRTVAVSYLGGPPDTSHLKVPLVWSVTSVTIRWVGEDLGDTETPDVG